MSSTWKFVDRGGNLSAHGLIKDNQYTISDRRPVKNEPNAFMYTVSGPGLSKPVAMRETTIWKEFTLIQNDPASPVPAGPVQQVPIQQPVQTPVQQPAQQPVPPVITQQPVPQAPVVPQTSTVSQAPKVTAEQLLGAIQAVEHKITGINIVPAQQAKGETTKDLLLSELMKLDFVSCNIKIVKSEKDSTLCVIIDSLPPLSHTGKDISAEDIVAKITSTFTEKAMLITSCREWTKAVQELNAKKEKETKKTKADLEKAQKAATAKPVEATTKHTVKGKSDKKAEQETAVAQQAQEQQQLLIPETPENEVAPEEFPIEESNAGDQFGGVSQEVNDFIL